LLEPDIRSRSKMRASNPPMSFTTCNGGRKKENIVNPEMAARVCLKTSTHDQRTGRPSLDVAGSHRGGKGEGTSFPGGGKGKTLRLRGGMKLPERAELGAGIGGIASQKGSRTGHEKAGRRLNSTALGGKGKRGKHWQEGWRNNSCYQGLEGGLWWKSKRDKRCHTQKNGVHRRGKGGGLLWTFQGWRKERER